MKPWNQSEQSRKQKQQKPREHRIHRGFTLPLLAWWILGNTREALGNGIMYQSGTTSSKDAWLRRGREAPETLELHP